MTIFIWYPIGFRGIGVLYFQTSPCAHMCTSHSSHHPCRHFCVQFKKVPGLFSWLVLEPRGILKSISCIKFPMIHWHHPTAFFQDGKGDAGYVWKWGMPRMPQNDNIFMGENGDQISETNGVWSNQPSRCRLITIYESWRQPGAIHFLRGIVVPLPTAGLTTIHRRPVQTWSFPKISLVCWCPAKLV